ncbi:MAG: hypothetical protein M3016_07650, partial [Actinomycetota bacterium]|nr:hypothetical protein [Actinomycetota bacterium]
SWWLVVVVVLVVTLAAGFVWTDAGQLSAPELAALVDAQKPAVARLRGLDFVKDVSVELRPQRVFGVPLAQSPGEAVDREEKIERALGLIDADTHLAQARTVAVTGTAAYHESDHNVIAFQEFTPHRLQDRSALVHELTHVLQYQHFPGLNTTSPSNGLDDYEDSSLALRALVEGDATRVQQDYEAHQAWYLRLFGRQMERHDSLRSLPARGGAPAYVLEERGFPYDAGANFTRAIVVAGGQARLDAAFTTPPRSTAEVLHPDRFLAGKGPVSVPEPHADGEVIRRGVLGEMRLYRTLAEVLPAAEVAKAAAGWAGDHYVAWEDTGRTCVRDQIVAASPVDAAALARTLQEWSAKRAGATISGEPALTLTVCG